jgi:hypothetical protein
LTDKGLTETSFTEEQMEAELERVVTANWPRLEEDFCQIFETRDVFCEDAYTWLHALNSVEYSYVWEGFVNDRTPPLILPNSTLPTNFLCGHTIYFIGDMYINCVHKSSVYTTIPLPPGVM